MKYAPRFTKAQITAIRTRALEGEPLTQIAISMGTYPQRIRSVIRDIRPSQGPVWSNEWIAEGDHWIIRMSRLGVFVGDCIVDDADKGVLQNYNWRLHRNGYAVANFEYVPMEMHRYLNPAPEGLWVNFINRNKLDCRTANIRHVSPKEVLNNRVIVDRALGRRGRKGRTQRSGAVRYVATVQKWDAYVDSAYLGRFPNEATAKLAVDASHWWLDKYPLPRGEELLKVYAERGTK
jgi:hypothetical protein